MSKKHLFILLVLVSLLLSACTAEVNTTAITASGTISANRFNVAAEIGGKVAEILYDEGETISSGDILFRLDDEIVTAQYNQAKAAVSSADAGLSAAQEQLNAAQVQLARAEQGARLLDLQTLQTQPDPWTLSVPSQFQQPNWYYLKEENLAAAREEVQNAEAAVETERDNLNNVQSKATNNDFLLMEQELSNARARFLVVNQTLTQANNAQDNTVLKEMAQKEYDAALADLENTQRKYERMLTTAAADEVLEARAKLAVANARLENAQNLLDSYQTREYSLEGEAAQAAVNSAEALVAQAEAGKAQAEAALALLEIQLTKTTISAPTDGVILSRNLQVGELTGAGITAMTIGQLDQVKLTVYIPEDVYGRIQLGQQVIVNVDSHPGKSFNGEVMRIADQAEFTPRNVQTVEGRKATVYAVEIRIPNPNHDLKPGMPADVDFGIVR
jgi:multidrug resistance efflux pump